MKFQWYHLKFGVFFYILKINMVLSLFIWWFYQLPSVEANHYDIVNSEVFAEICNGQMIESTRNYRAENDVDFKEFITDLRIVKNGGRPDFKLKHMERLSVENLYVGL